MTLQPGSPIFVATFDDACQQAALCLEATYNTDGWDQPAALWGLKFAPDDVLPDSDFAGVLIELLAVCDGHPVDNLVGKRADESLFGVAVVFEGWSYPPGYDGDTAVPPSEHPDRQEFRVVMVVLRDRTVHAVTRSRGGEVEELDGDNRVIAGNLLTALRSYLGPTLHDPTPSPYAAMAAMVLSGLAAAIAADVDFQELPADDQGVVIERVFDEVADLVDAHEPFPPTPVGPAPLPATIWDDMRERLVAYADNEKLDDRSWLAWVDNEGLREWLFPTDPRWTHIFCAHLPASRVNDFQNFVARHRLDP